MIINRSVIAVWFSCGAASAVAAMLAAKKYGADNRVLILNNPIREEDEDNTRFMHDVSEWIGLPIQTVLNAKYPSASCNDVWNDRRFMSGPLGAPCTIELKKKARQQWEAENYVDWNVLGFTADERKRHDRFVLSERDNVIPVLIDEGMSKQDCIDFLQAEGIELPRMYAMGYPNANCPGCVKATSATYWNLVREKHPEAFKARAEMSRKYGAKLVRVKGERIFLDELDPKAKGRPLASMKIECSTFCEETEV